MEQPSIRVRDIAWVAGLIDGEGSFLWSNYVHRERGKEYQYSRPAIQINMTDEDTIAKVAKYFRTSYWKVCPDKRGNRKQLYTTHIEGKRAIGWMLTLHPLMSKRRQEKINEIVGAYREYKRRPTVAA